jgi:hypothetical protein
MRPRFVDQRIFAFSRPDWRPAAKSKQPPPFVVVIAYLDSDGQPWLYTADAGLHPISVPSIPTPRVS